jgi:hypothetical protein
MLAFVTLVLASATRSQVRLAREEFVATHRPRLTVRCFQRKESGAGEIVITFTVVNIGNSEAILLDTGGRMESVPPFAQPMPSYDGLDALVIQPKAFGPGVSAQGRVTGREDVSQGVILRVYGYLSYADRLGHVRTTGFCRQRSGMTGHLEAVKDPDCEYED